MPFVVNGAGIGDAARAAGEIRPFDRSGFDDEAESDRHHREIRTGDAKRRHRQSGGDRRDKYDCERQRRPKIQSGFGGENRYAIGAEREKSGLSKRDLADKPIENIEADADESGDGDQAEKKRIIARREAADASRNGQKYRQDKNDKLHTRASVLPPNRPEGATANAAITAANVTICVLLDPSQVVAKASTRP